MAEKMTAEQEAYEAYKLLSRQDEALAIERARVTKLEQALRQICVYSHDWPARNEAGKQLLLDWINDEARTALAKKGGEQQS